MAVDPKIKQKAEDIRKKIFGSEVRESLASGLEGMSEDVESIKGRQDTVETTFQEVIDETTDKDVISAPEILDARQGHSNLGQNLLSMKQDLAQTEQDLTAQLQQNVSATNSRIDNLVIPLSPENTNIEVTDAHVSTTKNRTFSTIGKRFENVEQINEQVKDALTTEEYYVTDWKIAAIDGNGAEYPNNARVISWFIKVKKGMEITTGGAGTKGIYLNQYTQSKNFIRFHGYSNYHYIAEDGFVRIMTGYADDSVIADTNYFNDKITVRLNKFSGNDVLDTLTIGEYYVNNYTKGVISPDGIESPSEIRVRTDFIAVKTGTEIDLKNNGQLRGVYLVQYDKNKNFVKDYPYANRHIAQGDGYVKAVIGYIDDRVITDFSLLKNKLSVTTMTSEDYFSDPFINEWIQGSVDTFGNYVHHNNRMITKNFIRVKKGNEIKLLKPVEGLAGLYLVQYDLDKKHVNQVMYAPKHVAEHDGYVKLVAKFVDERQTPNANFIQNKVVIEETLASNLDNYLHGDFSTYYESEEEISATTNDTFNLEASVIEDVYSEYDEMLAERPDIMSKKLLGYGGNINNEPDASLPIYEYTIKDLDGRNVLQTESPTILILSGIHGDEKSTVWSTLRFFKQMLSNWHEHNNLESILSNVNFKIIPILNPGGYNANTRVNLHGVDCNRNFSYRWSEFNTPNYNKGASPYSELETQIARDWMIGNKNALAFIDYHNVFSRYHITYLDTTNKRLHKIYSSQLRRMSNRWYKKYGVLDELTPGEVQGVIVNDLEPMTFQEGIIQGIENSTILEVARDYNGVQFTGEVIERGVEVLANYILGLLDAYSKNFIK